MSDEFSIRMKDDDGIAPPASIFAPRPDEKGPKTIAVLLILGSVLMMMIGFGDIQNSMAKDFPEADLEPILENYQNQELDITAEDYQEYHDDVRDEGAYSVRGYSLMVGGLLVLVGGFMLFKLKLLGVKLAISGSSLGLIGGFTGTWMMVGVSGDILPQGVTEITRLMAYLCGICMSICLALAVLPIMNSSARMALDQNLTLVNEDENTDAESIQSVGNTYNINNISIRDSVVVDSAFNSTSEEE